MLSDRDLQNLHWRLTLTFVVFTEFLDIVDCDCREKFSPILHPILIIWQTERALVINLTYNYPIVDSCRFTVSIFFLKIRDYGGNNELGMCGTIWYVYQIVPHKPITEIGYGSRLYTPHHYSSFQTKFKPSQYRSVIWYSLIILPVSFLQCFSYMCLFNNISTCMLPPNTKPHKFWWWSIDQSIIQLIDQPINRSNNLQDHESRCELIMTILVKEYLSCRKPSFSFHH